MVQWVVFGLIAAAGIGAVLGMGHFAMRTIRENTRSALETLTIAHRETLAHMERTATVGGEPRALAERKLVASEKALDHKIELGQADILLRRMKATGSAVPYDIEHRG